jgi:uncharacterized repeat protein (TIGR03806 family)
MKRRLLLLTALSVTSLQCRGASEEQPFGISQRIPWTTSRLIGSPDPPLAYTVEKVFTNIQWEQPIFINAEPGTDRLFVVQQGGEMNRPSRILELRDEPNADHAETFLAVSNYLVYSFAFHPGYRTNGYIYLFSNGPVPETNRINRISRYKVERQAPYHCDTNSEQVVIEWRSMGHDGGGIVFGNDGMLYLSSGDGSTDSDEWDTGQDLSDLNGGILRIDVDHTEGAQRYSVPKDNPFVELKNARPENWAYGLRNPWRLAIDDKSGRIWVGNNGQDLWETAHLVRRGENYGWSVYEGSHPFYPNRKLGPTPVVAPTIEHNHFEARSLTGGVVYYGKALPELDGVYVYGDYSTGKIWGMRHDGEHVTWQSELANTEVQITAFSVDQHGRLLIADYAGGIYRLVRAPEQRSTTEFPKRLSETGLFISTKDHKIHPGVIPYSVNAPAWADGAFAERFIALPGDMRLDYSSSPSWSASNGAALVQTLSQESEAGNPASRRRIETRVLLRDTGQWLGYSYRWDDAQSDAMLVAAKGEEKEFAIKDSRAPGGVRKQTWRYPSRAECSVCHSRAAGFVLGLNELQLNKVHDYRGIKDNQLRALQHIGLFTNYPYEPRSGRREEVHSIEGVTSQSLTSAATSSPPKTLAEMPKLMDPCDPGQNLEARARSYLHVNCSVCHVRSGGGNSMMELGFTTKREEMNLIGARPQHATFGIANAMLIAPGDPDRSILLQRLSRRGTGQMPPLAVNTVDEQAVALFRAWISAMKPEQKFVHDWTMDDLLPLLEQTKQGRLFQSGQAAFKQLGCGQCHKFAGEGGSVGPDLTGVARRLSPHDLLESIVVPSKVIAEGYAATEIETKSGMTVTGRVVREDDQIVVVLSQTAEPVSLRKSDIRRRELSKVSNMPAGILNALQTNQILDLLAYLISDGNSNHVAFAIDAKALNRKEER